MEYRVSARHAIKTFICALLFVVPWRLRVWKEEWAQPTSFVTAAPVERDARVDECHLRTQNATGRECSYPFLVDDKQTPFSQWLLTYERYLRRAQWFLCERKVRAVVTALGWQLNITGLEQAVKAISEIGDLFFESQGIMYLNDQPEELVAAFLAMCKSYPRVWCVHRNTSAAPPLPPLQNPFPWDWMHPERFRRIAVHRRWLLSQVLEHPTWKEWEVYITIDADNTFDVQATRAIFQRGLDFDVVCANGLRRDWVGAHYDILAYRDLNASNVVGHFGSGMFKKLTEDEPLYLRGLPLVPVSSCFGGMAVYPLRIFRDTGCTYSTFEKGELDVEHAVLHLNCFRPLNRTRIFISPTTINWWDGPRPVTALCLPG